MQEEEENINHVGNSACGEGQFSNWRDLESGLDASRLPWEDRGLWKMFQERGSGEQKKI